MLSNFADRTPPVLLLFNLDTSWSCQEQQEILELSAQFGKMISETIGVTPELIPVTHKNLDSILFRFDPREYIVFNWCESLPGVEHSEWLVADYLEQRGFIFTGAGSRALALAQDKSRVKRILEDAGIATPYWQVYRRPGPVKWNRYPAIVKAVKEHCSQGIDRNAVVGNESELKNRILYILEQYRQPALVEEFIDGRELHVSLLGNIDPIVLPPAEMEFSSFLDQKDRICSFEAKFVPESVHYQKIKTVQPAPLTADELFRLEETCKTTFATTGCRDYARIDLRMKDGIFYVLDVNPNADISPDTSTVSAAQGAGFSYGELGSFLISQAVLRHIVSNQQPASTTIQDELYSSEMSPG